MNLYAGNATLLFSCKISPFTNMLQTTLWSAVYPRSNDRILIKNREYQAKQLILVYTDTTASNYTFMMWISCSITPQRGSVELRNSGAHLSTVNSLSLSRNEIKMIWTLLHGALSYCKLWLVQCGHGVDIVNSNAAVLKWCSVGGKRPKVYQHPYTNTSRMKCWYKTRWIIAFMLFMPKSDLTLALISVSCS